MKRNGYIDVIKFFFAIVVAEFHLGSGIFPGGRLAVEGFFIITGYLMMKTVERDRAPQEPLGLSTAKFMWRKYKSLFWYLLPAALLAFSVVCLRREYTFVESLENLPLLLFEVIPLNSIGVNGMYVIGISWYISSMFIGLSILYPFCRRFKQNFTLTVCPLIVLAGYGTLAHFFGNLAVNYQYVPETVWNTGIIRALAGLALGCLMYEASVPIAKKSPTVSARVFFTVIEIAALYGFIYCMRAHPKSAYDFILIFLIFAFLYIGVNGLSLLTYLWNTKWTKPFGTASLLIVISHNYWVTYFKKVFGNEFAKSEDNYWYIIAIVASCLIVYIIGKFLQWLSSKPRIKMWKTETSE